MARFLSWPRGADYTVKYALRHEGHLPAFWVNAGLAAELLGWKTVISLLEVWSGDLALAV